jgi:hypothetical protein
MTEELLEVVFSLGSDPKLYKEDNFCLSGVGGGDTQAQGQEGILISLLLFFSKLGN